VSAGPETRAYLAHLGLDVPARPTLEALTEIHRRHLEVVPYDNLDTMLGRPPSVTPRDVLGRIATVGRAGYCFHHNGALELALTELGYAVTRRHGHAWSDPALRDDADLTHLVLVVSGLPTADNPGGEWWPDPGIGEGFRDPLPLVSGDHVQGHFRYRISDLGPDGWTFAMEPRDSFAEIVVSTRPVGQVEVEAAHRRLSTAPDGRFTKRFVVERRDAQGYTALRGCLMTRSTGSSSLLARELTAYDAWRAALVGLGVSLREVDEEELRDLHQRLRVAHLEWQEAARG
jgi:N-hydroxyarylamine O-acetyltransferase